jgi:hypothetical protein
MEPMTVFCWVVWLVVMSGNEMVYNLVSYLVEWSVEMTVDLSDKKMDYTMVDY